jgi:hypothetical protein
MSTNHPAHDVPQQDSMPDQSALIAMAERELGAFLSAVHEKFGPEAAPRAGKFWLEAFEAANQPTNQTHPDWRRITIAAASRLATLEILNTDNTD